MRLINTHTLDFEEFEGQNIPPYAILSHRWEEEEVLYKDVERGNATTKKGWQKITRCCEQARKDELLYVWVDTCCIDKSSSAELTEAINSMFRWYQRAQICYVYLCDINFTNLEGQEWQSTHLRSHQWSNSLGQGEGIFLQHDFLLELCNSVWFTRGWTLQELLASESMIFFGRYWQVLGTKDFLCAPISHATYIPASILRHEKPLDSVPVAERMSWAARRFTTRVEDRAYSLMGIFGINMPMLYGEGEAAFMRLQEEILKLSSDQSILLWDSQEMGLLAESPAAFEVHLPQRAVVSSCRLYSFDQSDLNNEISHSYFKSDEAFAMTNVGLSITLRLIPWYLDIYLAPLKVMKGDQEACIFLKKHIGDSRLSRVRFDGQAFTYSETSAPEDVEEQLKRQCVISKEDLTLHSISDLVDFNDYGIHFTFEHDRCWGPEGIVSPGDVIARQKWSPTHPRILLEAGAYEVVAVFKAIYPAGYYCYMCVGFDKDFSPCFVQEEGESRAGFDALVKAGLSSGDLSHLLDGWRFDKSVECGNTNGQTVIKGDRHPHMYTLFETGIPRLWLKIPREKEGYLFQFRNR